MVAPEILMTDSAAVDYIRNFIENDNKLVVMAENMKPGGALEISIGGSKLTDLIIMFGVDKFKMFAQRCVMDIVREKYPGVDIKKEFEGNIDIRIVETNKMLMRKINPKQENIPILFDCTVSAVDERKTYIIRATVQCPRCGSTNDVKSDINFKLPNIICKNSSCHGSKMQPNPRKTVTEYVQIVRLQEPLEEAKHNSPVSFIAKARGLTVGKIYMGQKKRITGIFTTDYDMKKQEHQIVIEIIDAEDLQDVKLVEPNEKEIAELKREAGKPDFIEKMVNSFAPHIYGYPIIKKSILYQLAGGVHTNKRGDINILLVGDPSMAKSALLKFAKLITQKSIYANGKGSSGAGLTISMVKDPQIGKWMAQAGVYPLCDNGFALIDEFDKMSTEDRSAIHEVLEQGTVSIAKAGVNQTLSAKVTTLAAANPKYGKYNPELTLEENINLPPTILTRFDIIWLIRDKVDKIEDTQKARHILESYEKPNKTYDVYMEPCKLMAYINYVRKLRPSLTGEASAELLNLYNKMREMSTKKDMTPIGVRHLESMVRMCTARAKFLMKDEVDIEDVRDVTTLYKASFKRFGVDLDLGTGQQMLFGSRKQNKEETFWMTWKECEDDKGFVHPETLASRLSEKQYWSDKHQAEKYIEQMDRSCVIGKRGELLARF